MGGSSPKPSKALGRAAEMSARTGQDMLAWMKDQAAITNQWATEDRARFQGTFVPLQDQFIQEAQDFASPARKAMEADAAAADVTLATNQQMAADNRRLTAMGIDPRSGRSRDINRRAATDAGLAVAGARNVARRTVDDQGRSLRMEAINLGQGLGVNPATSMGLSNNAAATGFSGAMSGYGQQASILGQDFDQRMQGYNARMGAIGSVAGAVGMGTGLFLSSKDAKTDKTEPSVSPLGAVREMPVEEWTYKEGAGDGGRHIGPYAEDFTAATGMGDGKTIAAQDAIGVSLGAIRELAQKVEQLEKRLAA
jgi:hypothetical protein